MKKRKRTIDLIAKITRDLDASSKHVYKQSELRLLAEEMSDEWQLPQRLLSTPQFITFLTEEGRLQEVVVAAENFERHFTRYVWGELRPYELATSLGRASYLSHASAAFVHGLTEQIPKTIYINDEQSPKNFPPAVLSQASIDRAFSGKQRTTKSIWSAQQIRILIVSGKNTGRLEVGQVAAPDGSVVDAAKIERTLIDIAVRPDYAGGPYHVRDIYAAARDRISINVLCATLKKLDHAYPYHQVIGFYMKRAGYEPRKLEALKRLGLKWNFYLTYGIKDKDFDEEWQLTFPKGF